MAYFQPKEIEPKSAPDKKSDNLGGTTLQQNDEKTTSDAKPKDEITPYEITDWASF